MLVDSVARQSGQGSRHRERWFGHEPVLSTHATRRRGGQQALLSVVADDLRPQPSICKGTLLTRLLPAAAKHKTLKRGVKEVVKALRKSPPSTANSGSASSSSPPGIVVLAADISPMDVISHIPVLCEDHGIPYIYVPSRAELGAAGQTKRPTSVVMVSAEKKAGGAAAAKKDGNDEGEDGEEWGETFKDLVKVVVKAGKDVRV